MRMAVVVGGMLAVACAGAGTRPQAPAQSRAVSVPSGAVPEQAGPEVSSEAVAAEPATDAEPWTPPRATDADGSPRPYSTAELSDPQGYPTVGVRLTVLAAPPQVPGGFEPSYLAPADAPGEIAGVLVSPRWYAPLAWAQVHGTFEGFSPGPEASAPEPSFTFSSRVVRVPMELLVFGADARWLATIPLVPCAADPCPEYVSPVDSVVVVLFAGTAERLGIGAGWSIAIGG